MRRPALVLALLAVAGLPAGCDSDDDAAAPETRARTAAPTAPAASETGPEVTKRGLTEHLRALQRAADEHGGNRAAGTAGDRASAAYVSARLREAGWRVRRQPVRFPYFRLRSASIRVAADDCPRAPASG